MTTPSQTLSPHLLEKKEHNAHLLPWFHPLPPLTPLFLTSGKSRRRQTTNSPFPWTGRTGAPTSEPNSWLHDEGLLRPYRPRIVRRTTWEDLADARMTGHHTRALTTCVTAAAGASLNRSARRHARLRGRRRGWGIVPSAIQLEESCSKGQWDRAGGGGGSEHMFFIARASRSSPPSAPSGRRGRNHHWCVLSFRDAAIALGSPARALAWQRR
jgi:hypothetical protein